MKTLPPFLALLLVTAASFAADKPNLIFILADDLGYMDIGANNPKTFYETPHIDSLAKRGMRFTQADAPPRWINRIREYNPEGGFALDWQQEATFSEGMGQALLQSGAASPGSTPVSYKEP